MISKIPFDALTLAAVCGELCAFEGGLLQGIRQPSDDTITLELYHRGEARHLLICTHAEFFRVHFTNKRLPVPQTPPAFCAALRARIQGAELVRIRMKNGDRVLELDFGEHRLVVELMGKHSNAILIGPEKRILGAMKWVGATKSKRPITGGGTYSWPPVLRNGQDITDFSNPQSLVKALGSRVVENPESFDWHPGYAANIGAYPLNLGSQIRQWLPRDSVSTALESHFSILIPAKELETLRNNISKQLERVLLAREVALNDLYQTRDQGGKAALWQRYGELLLAFAAHQPAGPEEITLNDYDGTPLVIKLNPEKSAKECAQSYFDRAKKAKGRMGIILDQIQRLEADREVVEGFLYRVLDATHLSDLQNLQDEVKNRRYLHDQPTAKDGKPERAFDGFRVKELMGPGNTRVLYGENSEANDYLTLRVAKSNDWWLHVRGHTSAHVIIQTRNQPDKVSREALLFAAKVAVQNSSQKHSGYVPVDYTLKKYVRKQRGAPKGTVFYTHEKTIHVES